MKTTNLLYVFLISTILLSCSSSNDDSEQGASDVPSVTFDVDEVIALTAGTDISNLVSFNGEPAATYTTELNVNSTLTVGRPDGLLATDELEYYDVVVKNSSGDIVDFDEVTNISNDGFLKLVIPDGKPSDYYNGNEPVDIFEIQAINADEQSDIEYKYDLEIYIIRNNVIYGPYIIDPKIRIRARR
ncbi:hypothetical protein [Polaribacter sp.]|uniref:hypothetical protein n=1 Tax=Polaribacter sp. TaxID=1920175 RepID=UPI003EF501B1